MFDKQSAARIVRAVKRVERTPIDARGRRRQMRFTGGRISHGQYQGMNYTTVTQNSAGWDFQRAYAIPGV
jgi:hypothetical protein